MAEHTEIAVMIFGREATVTAEQIRSAATTLTLLTCLDSMSGRDRKALDRASRIVRDLSAADGRERAVSAGNRPAAPAAQQMLLVLAFINERPRYISALRASTDTDADYHRWSGGAEARRQLATALGLTVPHEPGETAEPALATVRLIRGGDGG